LDLTTVGTFIVGDTFTVQVTPSDGTTVGTMKSTFVTIS
jgi:hypothetical protein